MYVGGPVRAGPPDPPALSTSPTWQRYDQQFVSLMEELPRATSAPPHLQDRWATHQGSSDQSNTSRGWTPVPVEHADIRYDEDYPNFYERYSGQRKLPPPLTGPTLYQEIPGLLTQSKLSPHHHHHHIMDGMMPGGLEVIQEQGASQMPNNLLQAQIHALQQMSIRGGSPAPHLAAGASSKPNTPIPVDALAAAAAAAAAAGASPAPHLMGQQLPKSATPNPYEALGLGNASMLHAGSPGPNLAALQLAQAHAAQGQQQHMPPGPDHYALNNAAAAAAAAAVVNQFTTANSAEQQSAFQAAYQTAQQLLQMQGGAMGGGGMQQLQQGMQMGGMGQGPHMGINNNPLAAALAAQMSMPGGFHPMNPAAAAAVAAVAAAAVSNANRMHPHGGRDMHYDKDNDRRGGGGGKHERRERGRGLRDRDHRDRDRDRDRDRGNPDRDRGNPFDDEGLAPFQSKFQSLEDVAGQLMSVAQDQNGCRFLQRKFDEGGASAIAVLFSEVLDHVTDLMTDPFGNYLVQKLLDRCSEQQRLEVLKRVAERQELVSVALNTHGTRAVQKLIETLSSREQRQIVIEALRPGVVSLIKDLNGNHVVQRCLQRLGPEDSQFIYDAACAHCVEVATHRHGCCVLQRCIDFATPAQKKTVVEEIAKHALVLSQDAFGNYVVQYVLELGQSETGGAVMRKLEGHFAELSMQKFSSNVVEKCLKLGGLDSLRQGVVRELIVSPLLPRLLQDSYGNYVIQSALNIANGPLHQQLCDAIKPYLPSLRGTPHGKRILQKVNGKI